MTGIEYRDDHSIAIDRLMALREASAFAMRSRELIERQVSGSRWVVHAYDGVKFVLHTRPDAARFYAVVGFSSATDMMVRDRRH